MPNRAPRGGNRPRTKFSAVSDSARPERGIAVTNSTRPTSSPLPSRFAFWRNAARVRKPSQSEATLVRRVQRQAKELESASDGALRDVAVALRDSVQRSGSKRKPQEQETQLVAGAALVREALRRSAGLRYYDVQILAGLALATGHIAEMATGEGKTIVTAIPAFLRWIDGLQTHVATPNSYLAERDCGIVRAALEMLGVSVSLLPERNNIPGKQAAYQADVVYGTGYEFGFDYLRDQLTLRGQCPAALGDELLRALKGEASREPELLQAGWQQTVVDEIDSVLIDEAMTPLILSEGATGEHDPEPFWRARDVAAALTRDEHFHVDAALRSVKLTENGRRLMFQQLERRPLLGLLRPWDVYVTNALHAQFVLQSGADYVVRQDQVHIVDQKTGRIFSERSWRDGLHQAVEAFVGVKLSPEKNSAARITRQRFFQMYSSLCGMTGTAQGADDEFYAFYRLKTVLIPRHRPCRRVDLPDRFFTSKDAKVRAIVSEILERHRCGQPVLVGTRTIGDSQLLSDMLKSLRVPHQTLNGLQDAEEAEIVAQAGRYGAITVATNMAGRGTDIKPDERALAVGGLFVIGVERHETRRVDLQLAGRSGRQGDFGFSRFFVSAEDELIRRFAPKLKRRFERTADKNGEIHDGYSPLILQMQHLAEQDAFQQRRKMVEHDRWLDNVLAGVLEGEGR